MKIYENKDIYVRPLLKKDITERYVQWFYDQEVCKYNSHGLFAKPYDDEEIINSIFKLDPEKRIIWAVIKKEYTKIGADIPYTPDEIHIGNVVLNIDWINRNAEFTCIFGEKEYWGKGYCTQVLKWIIDHGINKLNLHKIWLGTANENKGMNKAAEKAGMVKEAILLQDLFINGQFTETIRWVIING